VLEALNALKLLGITISIDDFGTGYSSFGYLKTLPIQKIKIDKSFVHDIGNGSESKTIIESIINLAKGMNLELIAEGVETSEHIEYLKQHDCYKMQGFYFAEPMDARKMTKYLQEFC